VEGKCGYEAKCPSANVHVGYLLAPDTFDAYVRMQVQFGLWVTGWPLWYAHSYCPGLPSLVREVRPEAALHAALTKHIPPVLAAVEAGMAKVLAMAETPEVPDDGSADAELAREARELFR
jgi:hypothetical protein